MGTTFDRELEPEKSEPGVLLRECRTCPVGAGKRPTHPGEPPPGVPLCKDLPDGVDRFCILRKKPLKFHYPELQEQRGDEVPEDWRWGETW
jgi:hypothetical protein